MEEKAREDTLKRVAALADTAARGAAATGYSPMAQIDIAAKAAAAELGKLKWEAAKLGKVAAATARRLGAGLEQSVIAGVRAVTLHVASLQAAHVSKHILLHGWECDAYAALALEVTLTWVLLHADRTPALHR